MPTCVRDGALLHYELWQAEEEAPSSSLAAATTAAPWVTLVNGHTRPLNDFRMFGRHLVEAGFRVLALDNRGSGTTTHSRPFTLADMVGDVAALWDELGVAQSCLAGISMGGFIAQKLAVDHPERVARLALISTACSQALITRDDSPWSADADETLAKLSLHFTEGFRQRNEALVKSMAKQIAKAVAEGDFAGRSHEQRAAIAGFNLCSRLGELKVPTLVVHGKLDRVIDVKAGEELARLIPTARLELLDDAGHLLLAEKPRELYAAVRSFFQA